jgi:hypothetical protein
MKLATHSTYSTARLDELPNAVGKPRDIWITALGTKNAGSGAANAELASMHDSGMGL